MHTHGTAVLDRPAEAASPVGLNGAGARNRWLAKCESQLAAALAAGNADLLPEPVGFLPEPERCRDCRGTGYDSETLDLCYCMGGMRPAYDFNRYGAGEVISVIGTSRYTRDGQADVWVPCQHCDIAPIKLGPYDGSDLAQVPWVPDCPACNDTGWVFSHHVTSHPHMGLPIFLTPASLAHFNPYPSQARSALSW